MLRKITGGFVIFIVGPYLGEKQHDESEFINDATLDTNSVLVWKGNADAYKNGVVSVRVRTATSANALQTASWRTLSVSGARINPGAGEVWGTVPSYLKLRSFSWKHGINHFAF